MNAWWKLRSYEINIWVTYGRPVTLAMIPDREWDSIA
jgi:hypothetical protein